MKYASNNLFDSKLELPSDYLPDLASPGFDYLPHLRSLYSKNQSVFHRQLCDVSGTLSLFAIGSDTCLYQLEQSLFLIDVSSMKIIDNH